MINEDVKRATRRSVKRMARRVHDREKLSILQQVRRDLTQPWDQASIGELGCSLLAVFVVLAFVHHWMG